MDKECWPIIWRLQTANSKQKPGLLGKIYFKVTVLQIQYLKTRPRVSQQRLFIHSIQKRDSTFLGESNVVSDETSRTGQDRPDRCANLKRALGFRWGLHYTRAKTHTSSLRHHPQGCNEVPRARVKLRSPSRYQTWKHRGEKDWQHKYKRFI